MHKKILLTLAITVLLYSFSAHAWNALGHQVISHIAYQQLEPKAREKVDLLINDFNKDYPKITSMEELSVWPDAIRAQKIDTYTHWHYIDTPIIEKGLQVRPEMDTDNALWALQKIKPVVLNNKANRFERARFLAFLIHIVGDLHQPLHTVSLFSQRHPEGDRGGNAFPVRYHNKTINLHALWDKGVGLFEGPINPTNVDNISRSLTRSYPKTYFASRLSILDPAVWAQEGVKNAINDVYTTEESALISQQYIINGRKLAEEEATLAGYRLGEILNQLLG